MCRRAILGRYDQSQAEVPPHVERCGSTRNENALPFRGGDGGWLKCAWRADSLEGLELFEVRHVVPALFQQYGGLRSDQ